MTDTVDPRHRERMLALAEAFSSGVLTGDADALAGLFAADAVVHQCATGRDLAPEQSIRVARWMGRTLRDLRFEDRTTTVTERGFVDQYALRGRTADGVEVDSPTCIVVQADADGLIARIDEYFDTAATAAIAG